MRDEFADRKKRGDTVLLELGDAAQEELFQFLRRNTLKKTVKWLQETHDISVGTTTLSDFYQWYPRACTLRAASRTSSELEDTLKRLPQIKVSADQAKQVAQVAFEIQASQDRDPKLYAALRKGEIERERLALEREKFEHQKKTDIEKGLDALHAEIDEDTIALDLFKQLRARLLKVKGGAS